MSRINNPQRLQILRLLQEGKALTVVKGTQLINTPDFRSHIRVLRKQGYPIGDRWINTGFNSRCKLYFMRKGASYE